MAKINTIIFVVLLLIGAGSAAPLHASIILSSTIDAADDPPSVPAPDSSADVESVAAFLGGGGPTGMCGIPAVSITHTVAGQAAMVLPVSPPEAKVGDWVAVNSGPVYPIYRPSDLLRPPRVLLSI